MTTERRTSPQEAEDWCAFLCLFLVLISIGILKPHDAVDLADFVHAFMVQTPYDAVVHIMKCGGQVGKFGLLHRQLEYIA